MRFISRRDYKSMCIFDMLLKNKKVLIVGSNSNETFNDFRVWLSKCPVFSEKEVDLLLINLSISEPVAPKARIIIDDSKRWEKMFLDESHIDKPKITWGDK